MSIFLRISSILFSLLVTSITLANEVVIHGQDVDLTRRQIMTEFMAQPVDLQAKLKNNELELKKFIDAIYNELTFEHEANKQGLKNDPKVAQKIEIAIRKVLIEEFVSRKKQSIKIPDMEPLALAEYEAHPEQFIAPESVNARHILIKFDDKNKAEKRKHLESIKQRVEKGESFAELAKQYSEDKGSAANGGELGAFGKNQMVKAFEDAAFSLRKPGQLSDIIETQYGFHLIQLGAHTPSKRKDFADVKAQLIAGMEQDYLKNEMKTWRNAIIDPKKAQLNETELNKAVADILKLP